MTDLVLWRHGQTDYNLDGRIQGRVDIPLNETGLAQARAAVDGLAALNPSRIVSSPLQRARATAETLAETLGLDVMVEADLVEKSFGDWEGLTSEQIAKDWPRQFADWRTTGDPQGVGVETRAGAAARVGEVLRRLAEGVGSDDVVVVVSHGAALSLGATHLLGLDAASWSGLRGMSNCHHGVLRSGRRPPGWMLVTWNDGPPVEPSPLGRILW
ncbi:histidine phosphatase family protein [Actinomyces oricola]